MKNSVCCVIPNWNGEDYIAECLNSLKSQQQRADIIVVDNGSTDTSVDIIRTKFPEVRLITNKENLGFAEGVNIGIRIAIEENYKYTALLNNDAIADKGWLKELAGFLDANSDFGIVTPKLLDHEGKHFDGTGEVYTTWGIHYPRGRGEKNSDAYDNEVLVFGASGGASMYRNKMFEEIGLFDKDFFAYYEDVDLSFRAQLAGWKIGFVPTASVRHRISTSSKRIKGFATYQTLKNLPMLLTKNVPRRYLFRIGWRYMIAHISFFFSAVARGQGLTAFKGDAAGTLLIFKSLSKRRQIQSNKKVSDEYIWQLIDHDLPPNAHKLRKVRAMWWRIIGKANV